MSDYVHKKAIRYRLKDEEIEKYKDEYGDFNDNKFEDDFNLQNKGFEINYGYDYDNDITEQYLDIILYDTYGKECGDYAFARCLTKKEIHIYLDKFKEIIKDISSVELRYVDYCYYNGVDCPACYDIEGLNVEDYKEASSFTIQIGSRMIDSIKTVLKDRERLQQENEEIIVKNRAIKRESEIYAEEIIKLEKELEDKNLERTYLVAENNDIKVILENSISKDTIKEKMEELNKVIEEKRIENRTLRNATKYDYLIIGKRDVLKEILNNN